MADEQQIGSLALVYEAGYNSEQIGSLALVYEAGDNQQQIGSLCILYEATPVPVSSGRKQGPALQ